MNSAGNRLVSVTNPSYTAAYTYAADGLRLRVQESNNPNPDRWLQYDGVRPVLEGTLSGDTFTTVNKHVWEGDSYYDPLIYALVGGAWRYYMYDGPSTALRTSLGSTRQLMLHSDQSITDTYQYEAFGNPLSSTGTTPNPYRYVGSVGYYQTGSSLMHLGARHYMPELGRFISYDPAIASLPPLQQIGAVGDRHAYVYCRNNPALWTDPNGFGIGRVLRKYGHCVHKCFDDINKCIPGNTEISYGMALLATCCLLDQEPITKGICCGLRGAAAIAKLGVGMAILGACSAECLASGGEPIKVPLAWIIHTTREERASYVRCVRA